MQTQKELVLEVLHTKKCPRLVGCRDCPFRLPWGAGCQIDGIFNAPGSIIPPHITNEQQRLEAATERLQYLGNVRYMTKYGLTETEILDALKK